MKYIIGVIVGIILSISGTALANHEEPSGKRGVGMIFKPSEDKRTTHPESWTYIGSGTVRGDNRNNVSDQIYKFKDEGNSCYVYQNINDTAMSCVKD